MVSANPGDKFVLYTDKAQFDKICVCPKIKLAFAFAGDSGWIEQWKWWLTIGVHIEAPEPFVPKNAEFAYCAARFPSGDLAGFIHPEGIPPHTVQTATMDIAALFAGSGGKPARDCWQINKDARRAVETAAIKDAFTGGDVVTSCLKTGTHTAEIGNASNLKAALLKGRVMRQTATGYGEDMPLDEAMKQYPEVAALAQQIANGTVNACAPFPGMGTPYSDEMIASHNAFIQSIKETALQG